MVCGPGWKYKKIDEETKEKNKRPMIRSLRRWDLLNWIIMGSESCGLYEINEDLKSYFVFSDFNFIIFVF